MGLHTLAGTSYNGPLPEAGPGTHPDETADFVQTARTRLPRIPSQARARGYARIVRCRRDQPERGRLACQEQAGSTQALALPARVLPLALAVPIPDQHLVPAGTGRGR